jgi:hypothetical protein
MAAVPVAGFTPVFFLHHCNVDRIYESYLGVQGYAESRAEFRDFQAQGRGGRDYYNAPYTPFEFAPDGSISGNNSGSGSGGSSRSFSGRHSFSTRALGYVYAGLLDPRDDPAGASIRDRPVWCKFVCDVAKLDRKSYALHVFVMPKGRDGTFGVQGPR